MEYLIEIEREEDKRWIADIFQLPGVMVYAARRDEAVGIRGRLLAPVPDAPVARQ
jgi:hypothetical protein